MDGQQVAARIILRTKDTRLEAMRMSCRSVRAGGQRDVGLFDGWGRLQSFPQITATLLRGHDAVSE